MNLASTKLWHAMFVQIVSAVALFTGHIDGGTWVAASTISLAVYAAADVMQKKVTVGG